MNTLLIGLAMLAPASTPVEPISEIGAQYVAETGATDVACSQTTERTICYGLDAQGALIAATHADGVFTPYVSPTAAAATTTVAPAEPTTTTAPAAPASFGPGIQLVGTDIQPGTYRATVEDGVVPLCTWQRLSGLSGETDDIITIDLATEAGAQVVVEIQPDDVAFDSSGCTDWTPV
jgi:hypothetical protein